jgi:hypothetical protein
MGIRDWEIRNLDLCGLASLRFFANSKYAKSKFLNPLAKLH